MGRKAKPEDKKVQTLGASVVSPFEKEVIALAAQKERNKAWFSGRLLLRGYIAFLADGQWRGDEVEQEAINKGLSPAQLAIITAQLKIGLDNADLDDDASPNEPDEFILSPDEDEDVPVTQKGGAR